MRTVPEAPEALTGVSLLRRALPGVEEFIVAWRKDILTPSCGGVQLTQSRQFFFRSAYSV